MNFNLKIRKVGVAFLFCVFLILSQSFAYAQENINKLLPISSNDIFYPANKAEFDSVAEQAKSINESNISEKEKINKLQALLAPIADKYCYIKNPDFLDKNNVLATFFFSKDIRFGVLMLDYFNDSKQVRKAFNIYVFDKLLGYNMFADYENFMQNQAYSFVKDLFIYGPQKANDRDTQVALRKYSSSTSIELKGEKINNDSFGYYLPADLLKEFNNIEKKNSSTPQNKQNELKSLMKEAESAQPFWIRSINLFFTYVFPFVVLALVCFLFIGGYKAYRKDKLEGLFKFYFDKSYRATVWKSDIKLIKKIKESINKNYKGYDCGFDTNILIYYPDIVNQIVNTNQLIISKKVIQELDGLKNDRDRSKSFKVREAIQNIEKIQSENKLRIINYDYDFNRTKELSTSTPDEIIIGSYLKEKEQRERKVLFISNDRMARILAKNVGLDVLDINGKEIV